MQQKWNQNFDGELMPDIPQKFLNAGCDVYTHAACLHRKQTAVGTQNRQDAVRFLIFGCPEDKPPRRQVVHAPLPSRFAARGLHL